MVTAGVPRSSNLPDSIDRRKPAKRRQLSLEKCDVIVAAITDRKDVAPECSSVL